LKGEKGKKGGKGEKRTEGRGRRTEDSQQRAGKGGWGSEVGDQRSESRIADCGFKNKAEDRNSFVGAAF